MQSCQSDKLFPFTVPRATANAIPQWKVHGSSCMTVLIRNKDTKVIRDRSRGFFETEQICYAL